VGVLFTSFYEDYAFMGPVIVLEEYRGKKIGENLMIAGMEHLKSKGVKTIELDSVFPAAPLYRRLGFRDRFISFRFKRESMGGEAIPQKFDLSMTDEILEFDHIMTGLNRAKHLKRFCTEFPDSIYIIKEGGVRAYAIVRERKGGSLLVGPLVAENCIIAEKLFLSIMYDNPEKTINIGVLEPQTEFIAFMRGLGFFHAIPALRMYYGELRNYDRNVYGIIAAEKG
jgi:hypothetical protein